jgi:hypothetical protein
MKMRRFAVMMWLGGMLAAGLTSCELFRGPDRTGEMKLSSQLFGTDSYYLFGYHYEDGDYYRFPFQGDPVPDIINEGMRTLQGGELAVLPQFNSPSRGERVGFALIGEYKNLDEARSAYESYSAVGNDLQYETLSDTVELYQVWVQRTKDGNYAKILVKDVQFGEGESGSKYSEVIMDYTYQPNGSSTFPE